MKTYRMNFHLTIFLLLCSLIMLPGCDKKTNADEPLLKSVISIQSAENISTTSALLVARITPNQDGTTVQFFYRATSDALWTSKIIAEKLSGTKAIRVDVALLDLAPNTQYTFYAKSTNAAGEVISSMMSFTTSALAQATATTFPAESITLTSAKVKATITPNQANTNVSLEYRVVGVSTWLNQASATSLSGSSPVEVNFDLNSLTSGAKYEYRVKAVNVAGEVISPSTSFETYAVSDYDGNFYHSVTIGSQTWLKENFRGTHYSNGDPIANVTDPTTWANLNTGAYCWYNNDPEIGKEYGGLYNWWVGADSRGLIVGWHTPTGYEHDDLMNYLGGWFPAGLAVTETGNSHWQNFKYTANNSSQFTALPNGGFALDPASKKFVFFDLYNAATFWSSSEMNAYGIATTISNSKCGLGAGIAFDKECAFGLRLLKN